VTDQRRTEPGTEAKCPYCGCGFVRTEPDQVYCWSGCEQQHRADQGKATPAGDT
jgi:hypothetical protein